MKSKEQRIVDFIKEHGIDAWIVDGEVWAEEESTMHKEVIIENVKLESNWAVVREWLGY